MKKRIIISAVIILGIFAAVAVLAAQYISDTAKSTISASNVKIELLMLEEKGGAESAVSGETDIAPGDEVSRIAKVKNTGDQEAWIRLRPVLVKNGVSTPISDSDEMILNGIDDSNWEQKGEYWYYKKALAAGETSTALFTSVIISDQVGADFDGANLNVEAEGTQVKNNGSSVFEAKGWPSE